MYYNLDEAPIRIINKGKVLDFFYEGKEYFFKEAPYTEILKELLAEKIANRFGVACCHHFAACYQGKKGIVSEAAYGLYDSYKTIDEYCIEKNVGTNTDRLKCNNLEDIWNNIEYDIDIPDSAVKRIMDEVTDIFIFDALIANIDRHGKNFGIILDGKNSRIAPVFDNGRMLDPISISYGKYNLCIESGETVINTKGNHLYKFLDISDKRYTERFKEGLEIISDENLIELFNEIEKESIEVNPMIETELLELFTKNREMLTNYFSNNRKK